MYLVGMGLFLGSLFFFMLGLKPPRMTSSVLPNLRLRVLFAEDFQR
jgi:hypothetical protein